MSSAPESVEGEAGEGGATLKDLRAEEKLKIGNMLRELAKAQREGVQAKNERETYQERLLKLRTQNEGIIQVQSAQPAARERLV